MIGSAIGVACSDTDNRGCPFTDKQVAKLLQRQCARSPERLTQLAGFFTALRQQGQTCRLADTDGFTVGAIDPISHRLAMVNPIAGHLPPVDAAFQSWCHRRMTSRASFPLLPFDDACPGTFGFDDCFVVLVPDKVGCIVACPWEHWDAWTDCAQPQAHFQCRFPDSLRALMSPAQQSVLELFDEADPRRECLTLDGVYVIDADTDDVGLPRFVSHLLAVDCETVGVCEWARICDISDRVLVDLLAMIGRLFLRNPHDQHASWDNWRTGTFLVGSVDMVTEMHNLSAMVSSCFHRHRIARINPAGESVFGSASIVENDLILLNGNPSLHREKLNAMLGGELSKTARKFRSATTAFVSARCFGVLTSPLDTTREVDFANAMTNRALYVPCSPAGVRLIPAFAPSVRKSAAAVVDFARQHAPSDDTVDAIDERCRSAAMFEVSDVANFRLCQATAARGQQMKSETPIMAIVAALCYSKLARANSIASDVKMAVSQSTVARHVHVLRSHPIMAFFFSWARADAAETIPIDIFMSKLARRCKSASAKHRPTVVQLMRMCGLMVNETHIIGWQTIST